MRHSFHIAGTALAVALSLGSAACSANAGSGEDVEPVPYQVRTSMRTLCMDVLVSELVLADDARLDAYETMLIQELTRAGFAVVPSDKMTATWKKALAGAGNLYDRHTGDRDAARYRKARLDAYQALHREHGCDGVAIPFLSIVKSGWHGSTAAWDGVRYPMSGSIGGSGFVAALSLWFAINDLNDQEIYFRTGGVQVLAGLERGRRWKTIPEQNVLANPAANLRSIQVALESLVRAPIAEAR